MITFTSSGSFDKTEDFLKRMSRVDVVPLLKSAGERGVQILSINTPVDTGKTAQSWTYKVTRTKNSYRLDWSNSNSQNGSNVAILLQYGHGTGTGGYVQGIDYINPAVRPIFEALVAEIWGEVTR
jgi:hypothetical protein